MSVPFLHAIDVSSHTFAAPVKKIHEGEDVRHFLQSKAYGDIMAFLLKLNRAVFPTKTRDQNGNAVVTSWPLHSSDVTFSSSVQQLARILESLGDLVTETSPEPGPRRFGNVAFRTWHERVAAKADELLRQAVPLVPARAHEELITYLLGAFGSSQRLDYGSGHELSFMAFVAGIWKLGGFAKVQSEAEEAMELRGIVLGLMQPYFELVRHLILTYNLEPAGSHGVWGLDDHSFIPYIFGSAQYGQPIDSSASASASMSTPTEGSVVGAPDPGDVTKSERVVKYKDTNLYFGAIQFIYDVKKGPFWEHSPMLFDISGIKAGWAKINKGMLKMYNAEVLSKFPVVQHFPFGTLFSWEKDPDAPGQPAATSAHLAHQPRKQTSRAGIDMGLAPVAVLDRGQNFAESSMSTRMAAPPAGLPGGETRAPWAAATPAPQPVPPLSNGQVPPLRDVNADRPPMGPPGDLPPPTRAPWAKRH